MLNTGIWGGSRLTVRHMWVKMTLNVDYETTEEWMVVIDSAILWPYFFPPWVILHFLPYYYNFIYLIHMLYIIFVLFYINDVVNICVLCNRKLLLFTLPTLISAFLWFQIGLIHAVFFYCVTTMTESRTLKYYKSLGLLDHLSIIKSAFIQFID